METKLCVISAVYVHKNPPFVSLILNDNTKTGIYLSDGSPRCAAHEMLDEWLAKGNVITDS
jgi:hypothetical protein